MQQLIVLSVVDVQIEAAAGCCVVVGEFLINEHTGGVVAIEITACGDFGFGECVPECCGLPVSSPSASKE